MKNYNEEVEQNIMFVRGGTVKPTMILAGTFGGDRSINRDLSEIISLLLIIFYMI